MGKDIFTISGTETIVYKDDDPLKDLKESYALLVNGKQEALKRQQKVEKSAMKMGVEEDPAVILHQLTSDLCRNFITVNGREYPPVGTPTDIVKRERLKQAHVMDRLGEHPRYELAGLHQGNAAGLALHASANYQVAGMKGMFVTFNELKVMGYNIEGDEYIYNYSSPAVFYVKGNEMDKISDRYYAIKNNRLTEIPNEVFNKMVMGEDVKSLGWEFLATLSLRASVDYSKSSSKPEFTFQAGVESNHPQVKYTGPKNDPSVKLQQIEEKKPRVKWISGLIEFFKGIVKAFLSRFRDEERARTGEKGLGIEMTPVKMTSMKKMEPVNTPKPPKPKEPDAVARAKIEPTKRLHFAKIDNNNKKRSKEEALSSKDMDKPKPKRPGRPSPTKSSK